MSDFVVMAVVVTVVFFVVVVVVGISLGLHCTWLYDVMVICSERPMMSATIVTL